METNGQTDGCDYITFLANVVRKRKIKVFGINFSTVVRATGASNILNGKSVTAAVTLNDLE